MDGRIDAEQRISVSNDDWQSYLGRDGKIVARGTNGAMNFFAGSSDLGNNVGLACVADESGDMKAGMYVLGTDGVIFGDTKNFRMANPNQPDTEIWYACIEGPEAAAYLRGTARLENGRASITFPDHFQAVATAEGMTVQLTPRAAESKGLAVVDQSTNGIEVRELWGGTGNYEFHYTVMAVRAGYEDYQVIRPAGELRPKPRTNSETLPG